MPVIIGVQTTCSIVKLAKTNDYISDTFVQNLIAFHEYLNGLVKSPDS